MPTVAVSPSRLTHSWSLVNFTALIFSSSSSFPYPQMRPLAILWRAHICAAQTASRSPVRAERPRTIKCTGVSGSAKSAAYISHRHRPPQCRAEPAARTVPMEARPAHKYRCPRAPARARQAANRHEAAAHPMRDALKQYRHRIVGRFAPALGIVHNKSASTGELSGQYHVRIGTGPPRAAGCPARPDR